MRGLESPFRASQKTVGDRLKNKKHRSGVLGETLSVPEPEDETTPEALRERDLIFRGAGSKESTTTRSLSFRQGNLTK
jgi:hypothetical protein